eukprot:TRINITY_DN5775_c0_g1_i1.p1 TRINITY_DN5775_c0_g1~~TRINITY_DN5775_c0_g1_i1.p1  ORF type:complete len:230 (-),score=41.76 TRINITY_DN5775_c0_g1_i1:316-1005(-)
MSTGSRTTRLECGFSITDKWVQNHHQLYESAVYSAFIQSMRNGTLQLHSFKLWLAQDYHFVREFVRFSASVLLKAPRECSSPDCEIILGGVAALAGELSWFNKEALKLGIDLVRIQPQKANQEYCSLLEKLTGSEVEYGVSVSALWVIEVVYRESFAKCLEEDAETPKEFLEACQRWGNDEFRKYCNSLKRLADNALRNSSTDVQQKAENVFVQLLKNEVEFWNMAFLA